MCVYVNFGPKSLSVSHGTIANRFSDLDLLFPEVFVKKCAVFPEIDGSFSFFLETNRA